MHFKDLAAFLEGYADNLSRGGIFLLGAPPRAPDTAVRFELVLEDQTVALRGEGRVTWARTSGPTAGVGLKFTRLDARSQGLLDELLAAGRISSSTVPPLKGVLPSQSAAARSQPSMTAELTASLAAPPPSPTTDAPPSALSQTGVEASAQTAETPRGSELPPGPSGASDVPPLEPGAANVVAWSIYPGSLQARDAELLALEAMVSSRPPRPSSAPRTSRVPEALGALEALEALEAELAPATLRRATSRVASPRLDALPAPPVLPLLSPSTLRPPPRAAPPSAAPPSALPSEESAVEVALREAAPEEPSGEPAQSVRASASEPAPTLQESPTVDATPEETPPSLAPQEAPPVEVVPDVTAPSIESPPTVSSEPPPEVSAEGASEPPGPRRVSVLDGEDLVTLGDEILVVSRPLRPSVAPPMVEPSREPARRSTMPAAPFPPVEVASSMAEPEASVPAAPLSLDDLDPLPAEPVTPRSRPSTPPAYRGRLPVRPASEAQRAPSQETRPALRAPPPAQDAPMDLLELLAEEARLPSLRPLGSSTRPPRMVLQDEAREPDAEDAIEIDPVEIEDVRSESHPPGPLFPRGAPRPPVAPPPLPGTRAGITPPTPPEGAIRKRTS